MAAYSPSETSSLSQTGVTPGVVRDFFALTKPRLSGLVIFTTAGTIWYSRVPMSLTNWLLVVVAMSAIVGAANALNCAWERVPDGFMRRTASRPLPQNRLSTRSAVWFGLALIALSVPTLALAANLLTAALGVFAVVCYVLVYTPMKRRTPWAMQVGAIAGALPPLMGWTAATGSISAPGVVLFLLLFFWQLPHFIAIAVFREDEYRAAGFTSIVIAEGVKTARVHAIIYTVALVGVSLLPVYLGLASTGYAIAAVLLGIAFLATGLWPGPKWARLYFRGSLIYLTGIFFALGLGRV